MTTTALYRKYQKAYWACMTQGLPAEERKKIYNKMKSKTKKTAKPKKKTVKKRTKRCSQQQMTFF